MNVPQGEIKGVKVTRQGIKNARPVITDTLILEANPISGLASNTFAPMQKMVPITAP
jgi:hypothetical protein